MVDTISVVIGFIVGLVVAAIAIELGLKKLFGPPDSGKLTTIWSLSELKAPLVATTGMTEGAVPRGAQVVTSGPMPEGLVGVKARSNREVSGNFAVDAEQDRAVMFLGGVHKGALAMWTVDENVIVRLRAEFNRLWTRSMDYVEKVRISEVPKRSNAPIQIVGRVQDVVPYRDQYLMRLSENGETVGVLVDKNVQLSGHRVAVTGIVKPGGNGGFALVEALEISPLA